jgi:hypothetical protein
MRSTLSTTKPVHADNGPTLKETLDWLKEKIPLGAVAWGQADESGHLSGVTRQSQAWNLASCTIVVGKVDVMTEQIPPLPPDRFVVTERNTLPLSDVTFEVVFKIDNPPSSYTFFSGDKDAYNVVLSTSSTFVQTMNTNDSQFAPKSNRVNELYLPFKDEQLANRVRDAFKHAADLCREKEAF